MGIHIGHRINAQTHQLMLQVNGHRMGTAHAKNNHPSCIFDGIRSLYNGPYIQRIMGHGQSLHRPLKDLIHNDLRWVLRGDLLMDALHRGHDILGQGHLKILIPAQP